MPDAKKCLLCGKPASQKFKPFCSLRCSQIDLAKWLGEGYKVKTDEGLDEAESLPEPDKDDEGR